MKKISNDNFIHGGTQKDFYEEHETEKCNCPLCNISESTLIDSENGLGIVKCMQCDLLYTSPRVKNPHNNYFGDKDLFYSEASLIFKGEKKHHRDCNYEYELRKIKKIKRSGKLLDIGTDMGFFLRKAREFGYEVEGLEPSPSLAEIARDSWNLTIHNSFLENAKLPENYFDIITLIDVLEHIPNPKEFLGKCHKLLRNNGIIVIKVPNGNYNYLKMRLAKFSGRKTDMEIWDCYEHVVHYSSKTLKRLIEFTDFELLKTHIPLPIHNPVWANYVGHYYQYPSPFFMDWKRILLRNLFYYIGRIEKLFRFDSRFGTDLMFIIQKKVIK